MLCAGSNGSTMRQSHWEKNLFELIRRTSTDLPTDVESCIRRALQDEKKGSNAWWSLQAMIRNAELARKTGRPLCQDTGVLVFYFSVPVGFDNNAVVAVARDAVSKATRMGYLRQNTIDPVSGAVYHTNVAPASPVFHFQQGARKTVDVRLLMKGGGSENVSCQYSLPNEDLKADRDLEGVRRCVLDAVWQAQGNGCAPGVLGVCIGGDRATGHAHAKEQFLRKLNERSPVKCLASLERRIVKDASRLGIGPMGLGGRTTLLAAKVGALSRLPASFFVSVSYMCWAFRRRGVLLGPEGGVNRWLY
jgi:fumarate hydratase, class I